MSEIHVRELKAKDLRLLLPVLARCRGDVESVWQMVQRGQIEAGGIAAVLALFERVPDLWPWLADLAGMTPEQLDQQPPDVLVEIVDQLRQQPGAASFFRRLSSLLSISVEVMDSSGERSAGQTR